MSWETRNIQTLLSRCETDENFQLKSRNKVAVVCSTNSAADNCVMAFRNTGTKRNIVRVGTAPDNPEVRSNHWVGVLKLTKKDGKAAATADEIAVREQEIIMEADIIITTISTAGLSILRNVQFWAMIIDEAATVTKCETLRVIMKSVHVLVMIGDPKQLPPAIFTDYVKKN